MLSRLRQPFAVVLVAGLITATLGFLPASAGARQAVADERWIELDLDVPRALVHIEETDRIVIVGDDEAVIYSASGEILHRVEGLAGANDVAARGTLAVVSAPDTTELVVVDTNDGSVIDRIPAGAQEISSVAVAGDVIWYAHGPDESDAGVGRASLDAGTADPDHFDFGARQALVEASPLYPDSAFVLRQSISPSGLFRVDRDADGESTLNAGHSGFEPIAMSDDGRTIWAYNERRVVEVDLSDMTETGHAHPIEVTGGFEFYWNREMATHEDLAAFTIAGEVHVFSAESPEQVARADIQEAIIGLDMDATRLFVLVEEENQAEPHVLLITPHDRTREPRVVEFRMDAIGSDPGSRPTFTYECEDGSSGSFVAEYGGVHTIVLHPDTWRCNIMRSVEPRGYQFLYSVEEGRWSASGGPGGSAWLIINELSLQPLIVGLRDVYGGVLTNNVDFVRQSYIDVLGREPDVGGLDFWSNRLGYLDFSRAEFLEQLVDSPEFLGSIAPVSRLYSAYFGRVPDDEGLVFWLDAYRGGRSLESISQQFAVSNEFQSTYGDLSDREFVELVYRNVLDRQPDGLGFDFWLAQLADGLSRGELMTAFSESPEYAEATTPDIVVRTIYRSLLRREPDTQGFEFWTEQYRRGASLVGLISGFISSDEYADRFVLTDQ